MAEAAGATGSNGNAFPPSPQPCPEGRIHTHLLLTCKLANEEQALDMYLNNGASKCVCVCVKAVVQRGCCSSAPPRRGLAVRLQEKLPHIWQSFSVASVLLSWEVYWWLTDNMQWGRSGIYMYITRFSRFKAASVSIFFFHLERCFLWPDQCKNSVY